MKTLINPFIKIIIVLFITSLTISCTDKKNQEDQDHEDILNEDHTEMMEGDDHIHKEGQEDRQIMDDATPLHMSEGMEN